MWGKRRSAEEAPAAGVESAGPVGRGLGSKIEAGAATAQPGSKPLAAAGAPRSQDAGSSVAGDPAPNGAGAPSKPARPPSTATTPGAADSGPQSEAANGAPGAPPATASDRALQGPTAQEVAFAVSFTRIVSVLMRSVHYKHYALGDLEWLVVPPLLTGQCAVMEAKIGEKGEQVPVAVALWASVSEEVDKRLSENLTTPVKLRPDEWRSGHILWLVDAVGDPNAVPHLLKQVQETAFKDREARVRTLGPDARPIVTNLKLAPPT